MAHNTPYPLFCIGHPLLDIQVRDGEALLAKYGLEVNGYTLANDKQLGM
jgi:adenosine kinase